MPRMRSKSAKNVPIWQTAKNTPKDRSATVSRLCQINNLRPSPVSPLSVSVYLQHLFQVVYLIYYVADIGRIGGEFQDFSVFKQRFFVFVFLQKRIAQKFVISPLARFQCDRNF